MSGIDAISGLASLFSSSAKGANAPAGNSEFATVLAQAQQAAEPDATASEPDLLAAYHENLQDFRKRVEQLLERLGIDTSGQPIQVQLNLLRQLVVSGDHPQAEEAQAALQQDPRLTSLFAMLQQQAAQLAAERNPDAAEPPKPFAIEIDGPHVTPVKF